MPDALRLEEVWYVPNDVGYFENELVEKNVGLYSKLSCKNVKIIDKYYNIYIYI